MKTSQTGRQGIFFDPMQIPTESLLFVDSEMVLFIGKIKRQVTVKFIILDYRV
jgi:hypothetical protein